MFAATATISIDGGLPVLNTQHCALVLPSKTLTISAAKQKLETATICMNTDYVTYNEIYLLETASGRVPYEYLGSDSVSDTAKTVYSRIGSSV